MRASNGTPVNAVRGLLDMIARFATEYEPTEIVACWDNDWPPQWRVDLIPTYKTHRIAAEPATDADPAIESVPEPPPTRASRWERRCARRSSPPPTTSRWLRPW